MSNDDEGTLLVHLTDTESELIGFSLALAQATLPLIAEARVLLMIANSDLDLGAGIEALARKMLDLIDAQWGDRDGL